MSEETTTLTTDIQTETPKLSLGNFWTLANMLSLSRAVIVFPIVYLIVNDGSLWWLSAFLLIGMATDWLDGQVARWTNTVSDWGKLLDPLADKIAAIGIVGALLWKGVFPMWLFSIVAGRDLLIMIGGALLAKKMGNVSMSIWTGKVAVFILSATILFAIFEGNPVLLNIWAETTAFLFIYSFILYIFRAVWYVRTQQDSIFAQVLDAFANEITICFGVWRYLVYQIPEWDVRFEWIWLIWTSVWLFLAYPFALRHLQVWYPKMLHLPVLFTFLLLIFAFFEPDRELVYYGQYFILVCLGLATLTAVPRKFFRILVPFRKVVKDE